MNDLISEGVDDDRIASAARRIIRQYRLQQNDSSEESGGTVRVTRTPDNVQDLQLVIEEMGRAVEQLQRLFEKREAVFVASLERMDRQLAKLEGRVDAFVAELATIENRPAIDVDILMDEQKLATRALLGEFGGMMEAGRVLLDEIRDVHAVRLAGVTMVADGDASAKRT